jgi:hypothetical protein
MNDPRVVALIYRVRHGRGVSYERTAPLTYETSDLVIHVNDCNARFEMKKTVFHCGSSA